MNPSNKIGIAKRCSSFPVWRFNGERGLDLNASHSLGRQGPSLVLGFCIAVFCVGRAEAFRYWQEITVSQPGLVQARLPFETMEKARCREEIRLFNSAGEELPLVIQGLELGGSVYANVPAEKKYQILPDRSVLTFSILGDEMDGKKIYFTGDTKLFDELKTFSDRNIDLMLMPYAGTPVIGNIWTLEDAAQAVAWVKPKVCIPIHMETFGNWVTGRPSTPPETFRDLLTSQTSETHCLILQPGDTMPFEDHWGWKSNHL